MCLNFCCHLLSAANTLSLLCCSIFHALHFAVNQYRSRIWRFVCCLLLPSNSSLLSNGLLTLAWCRLAVRYLWRCRRSLANTSRRSTFNDLLVIRPTRHWHSEPTLEYFHRCNSSGGTYSYTTLFASVLHYWKSTFCCSFYMRFADQLSQVSGHSVRLIKSVMELGLYSTAQLLAVRPYYKMNICLFTDNCSNYSIVCVQKRRQKQTKIQRDNTPLTQNVNNNYHNTTQKLGEKNWHWQTFLKYFCLTCNHGS